LQNIFNFPIPKVNEEGFYTILKNDSVEIKTVVSNTLSTKREFVSDRDEWVMLVQGCAKIFMDDTMHKLKKGDILFIPAGKKHTLSKTKKIAIWLCIYLTNNSTPDKPQKISTSIPV